MKNEIIVKNKDESLEIDQDLIDFTVYFNGSNISEEEIEEARCSKEAYDKFIDKYYMDAQYNFSCYDYEMMEKYGNL